MPLYFPSPRFLDWVTMDKWDCGGPYEFSVRCGLQIMNSLSISSVAQSCPTLWNPVNCSTPGLPVHHQLPGFTQTHVHRVDDAIQPSYPQLIPFSSCLQSFPASGSFTMNHILTSCGQSIGASASVSVLSMNIQGWFPLRLIGLISLQCKGFLRVFSSTTIQKH